MNKIVIAVVVSLLAGFAVGAYIISAPKPKPVTVSSTDPGVYFDQSAATDDRIRALEAAVAEERNARQLLEEELLSLYDEIDRIGNEQQGTAEQGVAIIGQGRDAMEERIRQFRTANSPAGRADRLVEGGMSRARADWIVQREDELQLQALEAQFEARRSGEPIDRFDPRLNPDAALRADIGDIEYEKYLQANGRSTSVDVAYVFESSAGQSAGLQPGDQIVAYAGQRVFDSSGLNQQTMLGEPGQTVVVDILRDGMPMQVVMPRGPIGISTGRFRGRR
jgi:hypothetical protein